ncbi:hypothetical protein AVEN_156968-1 [Araneus ventricosus]|uniref:Uncharacterized protein n=1 Tax=Araneus ventricosus TaxID=182803 RepID=A0A4Y2HKZ8_ARAVE|nr:hypothetical protein AVEN_156968-1 [Araneus ventricosus]
MMMLNLQVLWLQVFDESEMVSSVREFTSLAYRTTVLRQGFRLRPPTRSQLLVIVRSGFFPLRELKSVAVSYSRIHLYSSDLLSRLAPDSE